MKKIPSVCRKPNYHTKCGKNCHKILSVHIAQDIVETRQKYSQYFIAIEILSQHVFEVLQNISSQHYSFNFLKYF